jgi:hypothetical protein
MQNKSGFFKVLMKPHREEINHLFTKIDETYQIIGIDESPVAEAEFALKINI